MPAVRTASILEAVFQGKGVAALLLPLALLCGNTVSAKEPGLDFYHVERFAKNITTEGHYAKRFRLCDLKFGEYEIPLFLDFVSDPKVNGTFGPFWKMPLLESRLIPSGKNNITFVSVTGQRFQFDIPKKGKESKHRTLQYESKGKDAELVLLAGDEENIFHFEDKRLVRWRMKSAGETVTLDFRRRKNGFSILSSKNTDPVLQLVPVNGDGGQVLHLKTAGQNFEFRLQENMTLFGEELGPVQLLSSVVAADGERADFEYKAFDIPPRELMVLAGHLDLYEKFHPRPKKKDPEKIEKPSHYGSIEGVGDLLELNLTWDMKTGFPSLCGDELCLTGGSIGKWRVNTSLWILRTLANPVRWERVVTDWRSGSRTYVDSEGLGLTENIILTLAGNSGKARSGSVNIPGEGGFLYRISYDKDGNERSVRIKHK